MRFDKRGRTITAECWPRNVDVTAADAKQYPGWPVTVRQEDNYGRRAVAWLPELRVEGRTDPVVQVVREADSEVVYTIRVKGNTFRPKVFEGGSYTIHLSDGPLQKTLTKVTATEAQDADPITVRLE